MTRQPFERKLRAFVSDVPAAAPRDLLESVLVDLPTVKQRRRPFGVGRRFTTMSTPLRTIAVAAAVLVVAVAAYSMLPGPPGPGASPSPTIAPTPTAAPSRSPAPTPSPRITGATVAPLGGTLGEDTLYELPTFEPPFTFSGPSPMILGLAGSAFAFIVHPTSQSINAGVVRPGAVFDEAGSAQAVPDDLAAWVQARTDLSVSSAEPVTLGSAEGTLVEAVVAEDAFQNAGGAVNVFCPRTTGCDFESGGSIGWVRGDRVLVLVATVDGQPITAIGTAPEANWVTMGPIFDAWLRSFDFPG